MKTVSSSIFTLLFVVLLSCISDAVLAQVCTGSLGDPVVNVNFGSGGTIGSPLPGATTTYSYISADCPADGSYTVISSTGGCFGSSWHNLPEDHTPGDVNGHMMLVNASFTPGDFYLDTVRGLCANTTYEFSAWVINVLLPTACSPNPIHPRLVFNIETTTGVVLGTYATGDLFETSNAQWSQYGVFFTTPVNANDVVIRLTNNAPGGCGNDLALDDITFRPCGPTITAGTLVSGQLQADLCFGQTSSAALSASIGSGFASPSVQWQESINNGLTWTDIPGATSNNFTVNKTIIGTYQYRLTAAEGTNIVLTNCRVASNVVNVVVHDVPVVIAGSNSPLCEGTPVKLSASGGSSYSWTGPQAFTSNAADPTFAARLNTAGQYNVTATDQFGCTATGSTVVAIFPNPVAVISDSSRICEGAAVRLTGSGGDSYKWEPAAGLSNALIANPEATPLVTTVYTLSVTNGNACTDTAAVRIEVLQKPTANAGVDKVILENTPVVLEGAATGSNISYSWTPAFALNDPGLLQPLSTANRDTTYTLQVVSNVGCGTATDRVAVKVFQQLYIPNAFSPNGDAFNNTWKVEALIAFPQAVLSIYNRAGQKIFEGSGVNAVWDGTYKGQPQDPGTYVYIIDFKSNRPVKKGTVLLLR